MLAFPPVCSVFPSCLSKKQNTRLWRTNDWKSYALVMIISELSLIYFILPKITTRMKGRVRIWTQIFWMLCIIPRCHVQAVWPETHPPAPRLFPARLKRDNLCESATQLQHGASLRAVLIVIVSDVFSVCQRASHCWPENSKDSLSSNCGLSLRGENTWCIMSPLCSRIRSFGLCFRNCPMVIKTIMAFK